MLFDHQKGIRLVRIAAAATPPLPMAFLGVFWWNRPTHGELVSGVFRISVRRRRGAKGFEGVGCCRGATPRKNYFVPNMMSLGAFCRSFLQAENIYKHIKQSLEALWRRSFLQAENIYKHIKQSLEALWHWFDSLIAKWSLQKQWKTLSTTCDSTTGGGGRTPTPRWIHHWNWLNVS